MIWSEIKAVFIVFLQVLKAESGGLFLMQDNVYALVAADVVLLILFRTL